MITDKQDKMVYQVRADGRSVDDIATELAQVVCRALAEADVLSDQDPQRWPELRAAIADTFMDRLTGGQAAPASAPAFRLVLRGGLLRFVDDLARAAAAELRSRARPESPPRRGLETLLNGVLHRALSPHLYYLGATNESSGTAPPAGAWRLRPLRPDDEDKMRRFHAALSDLSVYFRYLHPFKLSARTAHDRLARVCSSDGGREAVFAAVTEDEKEIIGVGRLSPFDPDPTTAELSVIVADAWQRRGVGTAAAALLMAEARRRGHRRVVAFIHSDNDGMRKICSKLGFAETHSPGDPLVRAEIRL